MNINHLIKEAQEAYESMYDINPREYLFDDDEHWVSLSRGSSGTYEGIHSEEALQEIRNSCRQLALTNEFAINGHENRISFIVGSGHTYRVEVREGEELQKSTLIKMQRWLDDFISESRWCERQQEIVRRKDRDGEVFIRFFSNADGETFLRFIEPDQIHAPSFLINQQECDEHLCNRFGIQTDTKDVEKVLGYWVDDELIPAEYIQHRKANVDFNVRRGLPLFYPVRKNLFRAEKLLRNMSIVAEIQSAIAIIRKHSNATRSGIESYVASSADKTQFTPGGSQNAKYFRKYSPGTILDTSSGVDYEFPAAAVDASRYVTILQAELRAIASRIVMPEFMLTSDASNANYSSTMVAEGPAVRMFERLQHELIREDILLMKQVMQNAVNANKFSQDEMDRIYIRVTPPTLSVRDRLRETQADKILVEMGAMSVQTMARRHGMEPSFK
ncbi:MAG: phage portal protein [Planctomycetia bacterium]|nr:phage portal protein [Planctomycetia bacterium]